MASERHFFVSIMTSVVTRNPL